MFWDLLHAPPQHTVWETVTKFCVVIHLDQTKILPGRPCKKFFDTNVDARSVYVRDSLHRLRSYCWETARRSIMPNFSVNPVGKTMRWIKKWMTPFLMVSTTHHVKCGEDRKTRAGCRCENVVFVFFCHAPSPEHRAFEGYIVRTCIALPFIARFRRSFQLFFTGEFLFQKHYLICIFVARWRHNFREISVKNCEKSKNRRKSLCAPLRIDSWGIWNKFYGSSLGPRL